MPGSDVDFGSIKSPKQTESKDGVHKNDKSTLPKGANKGN